MTLNIIVLLNKHISIQLNLECSPEEKKTKPKINFIVCYLYKICFYNVLNMFI